jgi:glycosyltransferase involved in cell wall biosynthesis
VTSIPRGLRSLLSLSSQPITRGKESPSLYYVVPGVNWVLDWVGYYVTHYVQELFGLRSQVVRTARDLSHEIVHYGSLWDILANLDSPHTSRNLSVGTIFHGQKGRQEFQDALGRLLDKKDSFVTLHTASQIMKERLLSWGVPADQLACIPLGVDLERFHPASLREREERRRELGVPDGAFCIGSFHKDGNGMADGNTPKTIKGPDVLVDVLAELNQKQKIFVVLSAPARGYVKSGLEKAGVPYVHIVEEDYHRIPRLYQALDLYLLTSREEGGPKGVLESLASGVPFVGTRVGLVPDVIEAGSNGLLTESEDVPSLVSAVTSLIQQPELRKEFVINGLDTIQEYGWPKIAARYYHEIYEPLLPFPK